MMAQVISVICDGSIHEGQEVPGRAYSLGVQVPGGSPWEWVAIDLCDDCAKPLLDLTTELVDLGRPGGRPAEGSPSSTGPVTCSICGGIHKNRASLGAHYRTQHGKTLGEVEGGPATKDGPRAGTQVPLTCPECGGTYRGPQGLGSHRARTHGIAGGKHGR